MSRIAFLYPGQGAQKAGMGADFYGKSRTARQLFDEAEEVLDFDLKAVCFEENDRLDQTAYTQPAMVATCLAMTRVLLEQGVKPWITAGLSLGEYAAIAAAGAFTALDAIRLVRKRGLLMQEAVPAGEGAMCAVLGMSAKAVEDILESLGEVAVANYNCPGQTVITGRTSAVRAAAKQLEAAGARRTVFLNVSGPFHSPFLIPASEALRAEIEKTPLGELAVPFVANATAEKIEDAGQICGLLARGICSPVRWQQSMERMITEGVDAFVEIGPGRTLSGFLKKINREAAVYQVSSFEDVEKVAGGLC